MLALAAVVVMAGPQLVGAARIRSTECRPTRGTVRPSLDPEGQRNGPLGCALCLAVADWVTCGDWGSGVQLNTSLAAAHDCRGRLPAAEVRTVLADACRTGFQGYELWPPPLLEDTKLAKVREKSERCGKAVPPGNWMQRLRRECRWYVQEAGEMELYRQWRGMLHFPQQRLDLFLCRNSGWLRPCINLFEDDLPSLRPPVVAAVAVSQSKAPSFSITRFRLTCSRLFCGRS